MIEDLGRVLVSVGLVGREPVGLLLVLQLLGPTQLLARQRPIRRLLGLFVHLQLGDALQHFLQGGLLVADLEGSIPRNRDCDGLKHRNAFAAHLIVGQFLRVGWIVCRPRSLDQLSRRGCRLDGLLDLRQ